MQSVGQHWIWHESGVPCHGVSGQNPGTQKESTPMNIKNVAVALVALIASSAAQAQQAVQWRVQDGGNGHWYRFDSPHVNWDVQRIAATAAGGYLACITAGAENAFVRNLVPSGDAAYLGAIRSASGWSWVSGEPWGYTNWNAGEPNGSSVGEVVWLERDSGGWNDHPQAYDIQGAVIEWSADCNNDGVVDYGQILDGTLPDTNNNGVPDGCDQGVPGSYPVQWRVEDGGNGHWYQGVITSPVGASWSQARALAQSRGGDLSKVNSAVHLQWLFANIVSDIALWSESAGPWVGAWQASGAPEPAGGWTWVDGTLISDGVWSMGQPDDAVSCGGNNNRMAFWNAGSGVPQPFLEDSPDDQAFTPCVGPRRSAIIEWSADCNNDGIVDYGQILHGELADTDSDGEPDICEQGIAPTGFLRFDHSTDTVRIFGNTVFPSVDFTYEYRVRISPTSPTGRIISEQRDTFEDKHIAVSTSGFFGYMVRNQFCGNENQVTWSEDSGVWRHVAWVRSGDRATLFVDGNPTADWLSQTVCLGNSPDSAMSLGMSRYQVNCPEFGSFLGDLDWIRVSSTARYAAPFTPPNECALEPDSATELLLRCNEAPGSLLLDDESPNDYRCELGSVACGEQATLPLLVRAVTESCGCPGDITNDGSIDAVDLAIILVAWGTHKQGEFNADLNNDGIVESADLSIVLGGWGPCPN